MPELAYIDAGSGSLIVQAVIATLIAVPLFFRDKVGRVLRMVRSRGSADQGPPPADGVTREG